MAFDNNERDEVGIRNELPPSYQHLFRQQTNFNETNLFPLNNTDCVLCFSCHNQKSHITKSLMRLCSILDDLNENYQFHHILHFGAFFFGIACYLIYYGASNLSYQDNSYVNNEKLFANLNVSKDIQQGILDAAKKDVISNFKKCILSSL